MIGRAWPPPTSQDEQRRNDRKEKKDVIEIHAENEKIKQLHCYNGLPVERCNHFNFVTFATFLTFKHDHHCY